MCWEVCDCAVVLSQPGSAERDPLALGTLRAASRPPARGPLPAFLEHFLYREGAELPAVNRDRNFCVLNPRMCGPKFIIITPPGRPRSG